MTLLLWSTKKEVWVIFCLRPGSDEKYSCEFLQVGTWQGFIYEGGKWLQHFKKESFFAKAVIKNMIYLMLDPGYKCAEHEVAKWCLLSTITFFIWLACWIAEKEVWIWRTTDVKSLKLTMSVSAITISNIRKLPWRNQTLDKKEEQTKGKDWCKESSKPGQRGCKPGQRGRQSEGGWGEGATPGHEEEEWSLQGQLFVKSLLS